MLNSGTSNIEQVAQIVPYILNGLIIMGVAVILIGITVAIYRFITHKRNAISKDLCSSILMGVSTIVAGFAGEFLFHYKPDFSSYRSAVPIAYIVCFLLYFAILNMGKR